MIELAELTKAMPANEQPVSFLRGRLEMNRWCQVCFLGPDYTPASRVVLGRLVDGTVQRKDGTWLCDEHYFWFGDWAEG